MNGLTGSLANEPVGVEESPVVDEMVGVEESLVEVPDFGYLLISLEEFEE